MSMKTTSSLGTATNTPPDKSLASTRPDLAAQWDYEANGSLSPAHVTAGSKKKVHWVCTVDPRHRWRASVNNRSTNGAGCGVCAGKVVIAGVNDLAALHPEIAAEWDHEANGDMTPQSVTAHSNKHAYWVCSADSQHRWMATIKNRTLAESGCPVCSGSQVLAGFNDLATVRPDIAAQWDYEANDGLSPEDVTAGSKARVRWVCTIDSSHCWEAEVHTRASGSNNTGCPMCSGNRVTPGVNDLATLNPDLAAQWDYEANGNLLPQSVMAGSSHKAHWVCPVNSQHRWRASVNSRNLGAGCPTCKTSKMETDLADTLDALTPSLTLRRSDRSTLPGNFELDIYFPEASLAVEFNGLYWHSEAGGSTQDRHAAKSKAAREQGIQLIHVREDDWRDRRTIVLRSILTKLGALDSATGIEPDLSPFARRVSARTCSIVNVGKGEAAQFLDTHHIQGSKGGSIRLGLRDGEGSLVALLVASVSGERATIERYATSCIVRGGFGRLESALVSQVPESVTTLVTFADAAISDSGLYENGGWTNDGVIAPDYSYVVGGQRVHKFNYRLKRFSDDPALEYHEGMTERELADLNGLPRIWDAGKTRWVKKF